MNHMAEFNYTNIISEREEAALVVGQVPSYIAIDPVTDPVTDPEFGVREWRVNQ